MRLVGFRAYITVPNRDKVVLGTRIMREGLRLTVSGLGLRVKAMNQRKSPTSTSLLTWSC